MRWLKLLEESSDETQLFETILNNETNLKTSELVMKIRQARQEKRASSSLQRLRKKKRFIREIKKKHTIGSTKTTSLKTPSTTKPIFGIDFRCESTRSFT